MKINWNYNNSTMEESIASYNGKTIEIEGNFGYIDFISTDE